MSAQLLYFKKVYVFKPFPILGLAHTRSIKVITNI